MYLSYVLYYQKLWEELENEDIPSHIREARLDNLKKQAKEYVQMREQQHGIYTDLQTDKEFLDLTTSVDRCIVHFYHSDFRRCAIMDTHLEKLGRKYYETKFAKINVENAKFLVERLKVQVLPAIYCFKKGIVVDRIVGFEELGISDSFTTNVLEKRLAKAGVIKVPDDELPQKKTIFGYKKKTDDSDDSGDDE
ncbi:hypothetical protein LOTGIDRAFT_104450 [Lottia gigantea]|uniref:Thioredoxin domain-containing protein 9 n=1 Tax=Lottia gigantea TaxID=225164 RepID=V4AKM6_LOTGI|nr:hypothetical protein LOTGIDRAFT_104450 [Lottia gigantea]ESO97667.1 hypothetical protein LOTGIDRAFT_104450 [Lottia gigantea]